MRNTSFQNTVAFSEYIVISRTVGYGVAFLTHTWVDLPLVRVSRGVAHMFSQWFLDLRETNTLLGGLEILSKRSALLSHRAIIKCLLLTNRRISTSFTFADGKR